MMISIKALISLGILFHSFCSAESDGIIGSSETETLSDGNTKSENRIKLSILSDSGHDSDRKTLKSSDSLRYDSASDDNHQSRSESDFETDSKRGVKSLGDGQLPSAGTSTKQRNAIPFVSQRFDNDKLNEYLQATSGLSAPKRFQLNGSGKNRQDHLRLSKEERDVEFFKPIRMPQKFVEYDHNRDGFISLRELIDVTGAVVNAKFAFADSDSDNNGRIDEEEFVRAPWDLSGQVERNKHK